MLTPSPSSAHSILSWSWGTQGPLVAAPPSAHPKGHSGNPELHSVQTSSVSIRSSGSLNVHYLGEMAHVISQGFGVCLFGFFWKKAHFFWNQNIIKCTRNAQAAWCSFIPHIPQKERNLKCELWQFITQPFRLQTFQRRNWNEQDV